MIATSLLLPTRRSVLIAGLAATFIAANTAPSLATADGDIAQFIQELSNEAITNLKFGPAATDAERAAKLKPLLEQYFDMPSIAKYMLGSYWPKASAEQQSEFTAALTDFLSLAYAKRFADYNGHEMEIGRVRKEDDGRTIVFTKVALPNSEIARVDWVVEAAEQPYHIVDIRVEGLSLAETHRQEFASLISQNGGDISKLIDALHKKTASN